MLKLGLRSNIRRKKKGEKKIPQTKRPCLKISSSFCVPNWSGIQNNPRPPKSLLSGNLVCYTHPGGIVIVMWWSNTLLKSLRVYHPTLISGTFPKVTWKHLDLLWSKTFTFFNLNLGLSIPIIQINLVTGQEMSCAIWLEANFCYSPWVINSLSSISRISNGGNMTLTS